MLASHLAAWDELSIPMQELTPLSAPLIPYSLAQGFNIPVPDSHSNTDGSGSTNPSSTRQPPPGGVQQYMQQQAAAAAAANNDTVGAAYARQLQQQGLSGVMPAPGTQSSVNMAAAFGVGPAHAAGYAAYSQGMPSFGLPPTGPPPGPGQMPPPPQQGGLPPGYGPGGFPYAPLGPPHQVFPFAMQDPSLYFAQFQGYAPYQFAPAAAVPADYRGPGPAVIPPPSVTRGDGLGDGRPQPTTMREEGSEETQMRATKRMRLNWTPQLHDRFVEAVNKLGLDKAVPKQIMQVMNVDGLTRENVASHLQKYRIRLKREAENDGAAAGIAGAATAGTAAGAGKDALLKKKRRRAGSNCDAPQRGCGSPENTEGFGSTEKSPQGYVQAAASASGEVESGGPGACEVADARTVPSHQGGGLSRQVRAAGAGLQESTGELADPPLQQATQQEPAHAAVGSVQQHFQQHYPHAPTHDAAAMAAAEYASSPAAQQQQRQQQQLTREQEGVGTSKGYEASNHPGAVSGTGS